MTKQTCGHLPLRLLFAARKVQRHDIQGGSAAGVQQLPRKHRGNTGSCPRLEGQLSTALCSGNFGWIMLDHFPEFQGATQRCDMIFSVHEKRNYGTMGLTYGSPFHAMA